MRQIQTITALYLISYFRKQIVSRSSKQLSCFNYGIALKHFENFVKDRKESSNELDIDWFSRFRNYLATAKGLRCEKQLSTNSANTYLRIVLSIVKAAADERLIDHQVVNGITNTARDKAKASCLSLDELHRLARTPCRVPILKKAFLFSFLTGIQWKEITVLRWEHLKHIDGIWQINLQTGPTLMVIPLNTQALQLLGNHGNATERIFGLHYSAALCVTLKKWALKAGVCRNITFHSARQTFGKMLLENGVPIELVSELLGHKHLKTTQRLFGYLQAK